MRRRLAVVAVAVTSMVALAFLTPLFVLVGDLAYDRAINRAERDADAVARVLAVTIPNLGLEAAVNQISASAGDVSVVTPAGVLTGGPLAEGEDLAEAFAGTAFRNGVTDGVAVYVPVPRVEGSAVVVRAFVTDAELRAGVTRSRITLVGLGMVLMLIAVFVADRLGRSVVRPVRSLSDSAVKLGDGDLTVRVTPDGPRELREMAVQFNRLAERIASLLQREREQAADMSHRLRTPLTAARLDVEALPAGPERERLADDLAEMERTVTFVIEQARRPADSMTGVTEMASLVAERVRFWSALAEDQNRPVTTLVSSGPFFVRMSDHDLEAMIDAVLGNVFSHTDEGVPMAVALARADGNQVALLIEDGGPGFPDAGVLERGRSGGASTGLGLDIVRRTAEGCGGTVRIADGRRLGGAAIEITLPLAQPA